MSEELTYDAIETCAGAGGQALGLHRAGFAHRALVELDSHACETLRLNAARLGVTGRVYEADLWQWPCSDLMSEMTGPSLLAGGVPCPPFSKAGKQLGADDERDLFPRMLQLATLLKPRGIMIENVRGLLDSKFDSYRAEVSSALLDLGYHARWKLLNASDFGVPQLRPRTIMVALNEADLGNFDYPEGDGKALTVGDTLRASMGSAGWEGAQAWAERANKIAPTLVGGSKKHGGPDLGPTRAKRAWADLDVDGMGIANELPPPGFTGSPKLTVGQAALLQGFPTWWKFSGRKTHAYRQVGNAFPPPVAEAVGRRIIEAFACTDNHVMTTSCSVVDV